MRIGFVFNLIWFLLFMGYFFDYKGFGIMLNIVFLFICVILLFSYVNEIFLIFNVFIFIFFDVMVVNGGIKK